LAYGADVNAAPAINHFSESSFVFKNAIAQTSWRNFWVGWFSPLLWHPERVKQFRSYTPFKDISKEPKSYELPAVPPQIYHYFMIQEFTRKEFIAALKPFKEKMLSKNAQPFYSNFLFKNVHFPYSGRNRDEINYSEFMSEKIYKLYQQYLQENINGQAITEDKIPLFALMFANTKQIENSLLKLIPKSQIPEDPLGMMNNESFLFKWKQSNHYQDDLALLKGAYRAKLKFMDSELKDVIDLFGDEELKSNTIIIIAGDHGTALMEHDNLHNGNIPFDEQVKVPLFIHFPQMDKKIELPKQISERTQQQIVTDILNGTLTRNNAEMYLANLEEPEIFSRDCPENNFSIREKNKWKYHWSVSSPWKKLFNLETDPLEQKDLSALEPGIMGRFEELVLQNQKRLRIINEFACPSAAAKNFRPSEE
jgi:hypothetical protein